MLIVYENFATKSGVTFTPSTEVAGFDADNLAAVQPSQKWRASSVAVGGSLGVHITGLDFLAWDTVAMISSNATRHRNALRNGNQMDKPADWPVTNIVSVDVAQVDPPLEGGRVNSLQVNVTATETFIEQDVKRPQHDAASQAFTVTLTVWLKDEPTAPVTHGRLRFEGATAGDNAVADFNLTTGAVNGSPTSAGNFSSPVASVLKTVDVHHKCRFQVVTDNSTSVLKVRIQLLDSAFSPTGVGTIDILFATAATLHWGTATTDILTTVANSASRFRVKADHSDPTSTPSVDSGWIDFASVDDLQRWSRISAWWRSPTVRSEAILHIDLHDPDNLDANFEVGSLVIGKATALAGNLVGFSTDVEEPGGEGRAAGGQRYRGVYPKTRTHEFTLEHLTRALAYGEIHEMYRQLGVSTPALFIADELETTHAEEFQIYGFLEQPHPIPRQIGTVWQTRFRVLEAI